MTIRPAASRLVLGLLTGACACGGGAGSKGGSASDAGDDASGATTTVVVPAEGGDLCEPLAQVFCQKFATCEARVFEIEYGDAASCLLIVAERCRIGMAAPDSARDRSYNHACAQVHENIPCRGWWASPLLEGGLCRLPPGQRKAGAPCLLDEQCVSTRCERRSFFEACGRCTRPIEPSARVDEPCGSERYCGYGLACDRGRCRPVPIEGADCGFDEDCHPRLGCIEGRCRPLPGDDEPCRKPALAVDRLCAAGLECSREGRCRRIHGGQPGETCGTPIDDFRKECRGGHYCRMQEPPAAPDGGVPPGPPVGTCAPLPKLGETCFGLCGGLRSMPCRRRVCRKQDVNECPGNMAEPCAACDTDVDCGRGLFCRPGSRGKLCVPNYGETACCDSQGLACQTVRGE